MEEYEDEEEEEEEERRRLFPMFSACCRSIP